MSPEAVEFAKQLSILIGLPVVVWLAFLIAGKARSLSAQKGEPHLLFGSTRLLFAVVGAALISWGIANFASRPLDYSMLSCGVGVVLISYPLISNLRALGVLWGLLATFAQSVLVLVAGALGVFAFSYGQQLAWPSLATLQGYASLVTWPVVTLFGGLLFFPYLARILGNVESLEGFGGKISLRKQEQIEDAVAEQVEEEVDVQNAVDEIRKLPRSVRAQSRRYTNIINAWGILAKLISELAVPFGGKNDLTKVRENLKLLLERGVVDQNIVDRAERLFKERNGFKRRDAPIEAAEHRSYLDRAQVLAEKMVQLNIKPSAGSVGAVSSARH